MRIPGRKFIHVHLPEGTGIDDEYVIKKEVEANFIFAPEVSGEIST